MSHQRYITSSHKALINQIQDRAIEVSEAGRYEVWVDYFGHTQQLDVRVYPVGGEKAIYRNTVYLPKAGRDEPESITELTDALEYLSERLEEMRP